MNRLSKRQSSTLIAINIICALTRFIVMGWTLMFFFWIIIPFYLLHLKGQIVTCRKNYLSTIDKALIGMSTVIILVLTLVQHDCADNRCYYLLDAIYSMVTKGSTFMPVPKEEFFSPVVISLLIFDSAINTYLLLKLKNKNNLYSNKS